MFISSKGDILINELPSRPHNSADLTIEHCCPNIAQANLNNIDARSF